MRSPSTNNFEKIYQAALAQDPTQLPDTCIDEFELDQYGMSAAGKLASEGNETAANWLIQRGASISFAARGAAIGGHKVFARELLREGADINGIAEGAAIGGHESFARELLREGASIHRVARGAAIGGHKVFARKLLRAGAYIHMVAQGAAIGGHEAFSFARQLLREGADINWVAQGVTIGGQGHEAFFSFSRLLVREGAYIDYVVQGAVRRGYFHSEEGPLRFLSNFSEKNRKRITKRLSSLEDPINIETPLLKRAGQIARLKESGSSYPLARLYTQPVKPYTITQDDENRLSISPTTDTLQSNDGALLLLAAFVYCKAPATDQICFEFPREVWCTIFNYVFETKLSGSEIEALAFLSIKLMACQPVKNYKHTLWFCQPDKKSRAENFEKKVVKSTDIKTFLEVMHANREHQDPPLAEIAGRWIDKLGEDEAKNTPALLPAATTCLASECT